MFQEDFKNKIRNKKFKKKPKQKIRDRFGKARKNKLIEKDSIEKFDDGFNEFIED